MSDFGIRCSFSAPPSMGAEVYSAMANNRFRGTRTPALRLVSKIHGRSGPTLSLWEDRERGRGLASPPLTAGDRRKRFRLDEGRIAVAVRRDRGARLIGLIPYNRNPDRAENLPGSFTASGEGGVLTALETNAEWNRGVPSRIRRTSHMRLSARPSFAPHQSGGRAYC